MKRADGSGREARTFPSGAPAVKPVHQARPARGLGRHLEGWPVGLALVLAALGGAVLAVPRPVEPDVLPLPAVDRVALEAESGRERARADAALRAPLPFDVRAVGEAVRRHGAAAAAGDAGAAGEARGDAARLAVIARRQHGDELLLALRAVQTELFLRALARWEVSGETSDDLRELGGGFLEKSERCGWRRGPRRLLPDGETRRTLFVVRWTQLVGLLQSFPFAPSLDRWRAYYAFLLAHPEAPLDAPADRWKSQLASVQALASRDTDFPGNLARGVILTRMGARAPAEQALRAHVERRPEGAHSLRARNLLAAVAGSAELVEP